MKRFARLRCVVSVLVVAYLLAFAIVYFFQNRLVFQRTVLPTAYQFQFDQPYQEYFIKVSEADSLCALFFKTDSVAKGLVLYFHGNADNLQRWGQYAVDFTSLGYDVLMVDYRGYGKSTGTPDEVILYEDAAQVVQWTKQHIAYSKLVIYGRSLGAAVASQVALTVHPALLILETPFDRLASVLYGFPARYHFNNADVIPKLECKIVVFHGTNDGVVPLRSARRLEPLLKLHDQFLIIEGGSHTNLRSFAAYHQALAAILQ